MVLQLCEYTKSHQIVCFKSANLFWYVKYLNWKAKKKKGTAPEVPLLPHHFPFPATKTLVYSMWPII